MKKSFIIDWIDLRPLGTPAKDLVPDPGSALHLLRSLLGVDHHHSPWICETVNDNVNTSVLLLAQRPQLLVDLRVSDAAPSWCLHAIGELQKGGTMLIYRRLPPRTQLASNSIEPEPPPACLYQMQRDDQGNVTYRLVGAPYLDAVHEYPQLAKLFEHQQLLREEALNVAQWVAWPETAHYKPTGATDHPWRVAPLCYCFPADDVSKRKWVEPVCQMLPEMTRLLRDILGEALRTALLSRLEPHARLEAHTGWSDLANHVYRIHIPLQIPPGHLCGTWVDGCVETHHADNIICFDDSKIHRAFNYSNQTRIVLIVDLVRPPDMPEGTATGGHTDQLDAFIEQMGVVR